jgi:hypothetical protein
MYFMKDDQQAIVRYMLSYPHILSLDTPRLVVAKRAKQSKRGIDLISRPADDQDLLTDLGTLDNIYFTIAQHI